ncbi:uncharacterized protein C18orf63 isoform X2 [Bombyx mori]|uniref:uncharacterized protein C18orf63 isoform X2 n=1 Tax=Bombyx mori TaxID=7091 RepID=UPI002ED319B3
MDHNYKYSLKNPNFLNIGYINAVANLNDKRDRSAPSSYHWKILKCRMLIFSNSSILACPDKTDVKQIHVIFNKVGDDYDMLNSMFLRFSLIQQGRIKNATPELFERCFHYTMTAKLAPVWNVLGYNFMINNREFLTSTKSEDGIKYSIRSSELVTAIELKPVKIHLIRSKEEFVVGETIRVLPSLNKACIDDFCNSLSESNNFKCYKDLRRHWKNIHGYRLPNDECPYYKVRFWRGEPLTYPKICILKDFPIVTPVQRPREVYLVL